MSDDQKKLLTLVATALVVGGIAGVLLLGPKVDITGRATGTVDPWEGVPADIVVFPSPGAIDIQFEWSGEEIPQPPAPPTGYPSGPVITMQSRTGELNVTKATLIERGETEEVVSQLLLPGLESRLHKGHVALIPNRPLKPLTSYIVTFYSPEAESGDGVLATWPFMTGADGCDPTAQDCVTGRGCYPWGEGFECLWAGTLTLGEPCGFRNACEPGLACYLGHCRALCDVTDSAPPDLACDRHCVQGTLPISSQEGLTAAYCMSDSCLHKEHACAEGNACYRFGTAFLCHREGEVPAGETCEQPNDCEPGSSCIGLNNVLECRTFCDGPGMPACADVCDRGARVMSDDPPASYCR